MSRLHLILPTKSAFDDQAEMSCSIRNRSKVTYAGCLIYMIKKMFFGDSTRSILSTFVQILNRLKRTKVYFAFLHVSQFLTSLAT